MSFYDVLHRSGFRSLVRTLYRVEVRGSERVPAHGPCLLVANHESVVDPFVLALVTLRRVRYMAKAELFRNRLLAAALRSLGAFPVERGAGDRAAFREAVELLERGELLGIFPQGTAKQHRPRAWQRGAARLALVTGAPIVPVRMAGTRDLPPRARVEIRVGAPIAVERRHPTVAAAKALTAQVERGVLTA